MMTLAAHSGGASRALSPCEGFAQWAVFRQLIDVGFFALTAAWPS
jgi:hypothetical protein